jgi:hypothetical protein
MKCDCLGASDIFRLGSMIILCRNFENLSQGYVSTTSYSAAAGFAGNEAEAESVVPTRSHDVKPLQVRVLSQMLLERQMAE